MNTARVVNLDTITLESGAHRNWEDGACLLEAVSFIAGEPFSDSPRCVSPVLAAYGRSLNDRLGVDDRQQLKAYIPRLIGTVDEALEEARATLAADWTIRTVLPRWLDLAEAPDRAAQLRALPTITTYEAVREHRALVRVIRDEMYAARAKARNSLRARILAELEKREVPAVDAAVAAAAVAVAVAVADAVAVVAAVAVAVAVVAAAADAVAVVAVAADAVAVVAVAADVDVDADADVDAAAAADVDVDVDADAAADADVDADAAAAADAVAVAVAVVAVAAVVAAAADADVDAAAAADADVDVDAAAAADADVDADAAAAADAVAVAVAVVAAVADAVVAAVADAVVAAVAVAVVAADVDVDAVADAAVDRRYSDRWWPIYRAVRASLEQKIRDGSLAGKWADTARVTNQEAIDLLGRMIEVTA